MNAPQSKRFASSWTPGKRASVWNAAALVPLSTALGWMGTEWPQPRCGWIGFLDGERLARVNVALDNEVGLPAEASALAGVGQNGFQVGQNVFKVEACYF